MNQNIILVQNLIYIAEDFIKMLEKNGWDKYDSYSAKPDVKIKDIQEIINEVKDYLREF